MRLPRGPFCLQDVIAEMGIFRVDQCESTQDLAWASQPPTSPQGDFFIATRQTHGRGRGGGRQWVSPAGGLYLSWRLQLDDPTGFTLLGGLAVARSLLHFGAKPWLKWPNDCWVGSAKIAGTLSDCRWRGSQCLGLVLGIGVNVSVDAAQLPEQATSLQLCSEHPPDLPQFSEFLMRQLTDLLEVHRSQGLAGYLDEVRALSIAAGTPVRYWLDGREQQGVVAGLDDQGFLLLQSGVCVAAVDRLVVDSGADNPRTIRG